MQATQSLTEDYAVPKAHSKAGRISTSGKPAGRQCGIPGLCQSRASSQSPKPAHRGRTDTSITIASAILGRVLHHCTVINIKGESYRLKEPKEFMRQKQQIVNHLFSAHILHIFLAVFLHERSHREDQKRFYFSHAFFSLDDFAKQIAVHNAAPTTFL